MKKFLRRLGYISMAATLAAGTVGCGLLPTEEQEHKVTIVTSDVSEEYDLAMADRGDVILTETIMCTYSQLAEEQLKFKVAGRRVEYVYVEESDEVKAGQLVAELRTSDLTSAIERMTKEIRECELKITQTNELIEFYDGRINSASTSAMDKETYILEKQSCNEKLAEYRKTIDYDTKAIAKNEEVIAECKLYAGIDGTVSKIRENISDWTSTLDGSVMTIIDTSVCAFQGEAKQAQKTLKIGDPAMIFRGSIAEGMASTVTSVDTETGKIVFELDEPDFSLSVGTKGNVTVELAEARNVVRLPRVAVYSTDTMEYVYVLSENGVRELMEVKTGIHGNDYVEILEGVEVGDSVILR